MSEVSDALPCLALLGEAPIELHGNRDARENAKDDHRERDNRLDGAQDFGLDTREKRGIVKRGSQQQLVTSHPRQICPDSSPEQVN